MAGQYEVPYMLSPQDAGSLLYYNSSDARVIQNDMQEYSHEVVYTPRDALFSQQNGRLQGSPMDLEGGSSSTANAAVT